VSQIRSFTSHSVLALAEAGIIALIILALIVAPALAAKGGGGKGGKPSKPSGSSTVTLVMVEDANGNGLPNWADTITFDVSTTATQYPYLSVRCYQGGVLVYGADAGFYADYPWPGARLMPLSSPSWTGGAADCVAVLNDNLATLSFLVAA
jgi:hypothetical protein